LFTAVSSHKKTCLNSKRVSTSNSCVHDLFQYQTDWTRHMTFQTSSVRTGVDAAAPAALQKAKWQVQMYCCTRDRVGKPLATFSRASCAGLPRVELSSLVLRCCAAPPSLAASPAPAPQPPSASPPGRAFAPPGPPFRCLRQLFLHLAAAEKALRQNDRNIACGVCASEGVRGPSVARMQPGRPCRVARTVSAVPFAVWPSIFRVSPLSRLATAPRFVFVCVCY
jgi:hypothetical protein